MIMFNGGEILVLYYIPPSFLLLQCFILHFSLIYLINLNVEFFYILYIINYKY